MSAIIVETWHGPMLVPPHDMYVGRSLQENGVFSPAEFAAWRPYLPAGGVVVDVGANIGGHTFAFAEAVGRRGMVIAVEPQRMLFAMLAGSQALIGATQVWPRWCALGATTGVVTVPLLNTDLPNNFGGLPLAEQTDGEPVAMVPLDAWGLEALDFLKIDVEGMELGVLQGAAETIARCRPVLAVEADRREHYADVLGFLLDHDYHPFLQTPTLGPQWPTVSSKNFLAVPIERGLPAPSGEGIAPIAGLSFPVSV